MLDEIKQMQQQGMSDGEIVQRLREQGLPPMDINNALEQSQIKSAIGDTSSDEMHSNEMQPSVLQQEPDLSQEQQYQQYPQQEYSQQMQQYPQMQQYASSGADNMAEIAEQIAEEKVNSFRKKIGNVDELKIMLAKKIETLDERLKKIEEIIELLQKAIISRIGSYGDSVEQIKDEMSMMQDSFSKALPGFKKHGGEHKSETKHKSDGFEHFLRK